MISFKDYVKIKLILEEQDSTAVLAFGRMNPPSIGHLEMMNDLVKLGKKYGCTPFLFLSHTQDKKKNPLSYDDKIRFVTKYAPEGLNVCRSDVRTFMEACKEVVRLGAKRIIFVCGDDRKDEYERLLNKYNDSEIGAESTEVVSGSRTEGVSGSKLRALAAEGDFEGFKKVSIATDEDDAREIYNLVRQGLRIKD